MKATKLLLTILAGLAVVIAFQGIASAQTVDFSASPVTGNAPLTVYFSDQSTGMSNPTWYWEFGDGITSTDQNPTHIYPAGNYTVTLTVTDEYGNFETQTKPYYIKANLTVDGNVTSPQSLSMDTLYSYPLITQDVSYHKHNDLNTYWYYGVVGADLNYLLNQLTMSPNAVNITFVGSDGYAASIPISEIRSNSSSVIAFNCTTDGTLRDVIPSQYYAQKWVSKLCEVRVDV